MQDIYKNRYYHPDFVGLFYNYSIPLGNSQMRIGQGYQVAALHLVGYIFFYVLYISHIADAKASV